MSSKFVLITGASGAIGSATALKLAEEGYSLYLHYHTNRGAIDTLIGEIAKYNVEAIPVCADLGSEEGAAELSRQILSLHGIVLNSGKSHYGLITDVSMAELHQMTQLHVMSPFILVQKLMPKLMKADQASIVAVTSIWGDTGASCEVLYSMLKGAQNAFVKALSKEVAPMGIRVNAVSPGAVDTAMMASFTDEEKKELSEDIPLGRLAQADEIAESVLFLLSDRASYTTGHVLKVNGGWFI
ncbi:elongation factor P 5-aminopentanone reductase [Bacillus sp. 1P06AnD]|uniref:elongation factor P 5-aminopentanone reductase n=1 Tax=Bacillus sp. 1P06AnD TaxID=3132208 RepID=UPI0039A2FE6A